MTRNVSLAAPPTRTLADDVWSDEVWETLTPVLESQTADTPPATAPNTILITGPVGAGKSHLATAIAGEIGNDVYEIESLTPDQIVDLTPDLVDQLVAERPCTVVYDMLEPLEHQTVGAEKVDTLTHCIQRIREVDELVLVATARNIAALPQRLTHAGVFDVLCPLAYPEPERREHLLSEFLNAVEVRVQLPADDRATLVNELDGFSSADIRTVVRRAVGYAHEETPALLTVSELERAIARLTEDIDLQDEAEAGFFGDSEYDTFYTYDSNLASDEDETEDEPVGFTLSDDDNAEDPHIAIQQLDEIPSVSYDDVGGLSDAKRVLRESIEWPREHPELCADLDIDTARGILLHGPPGNGKTMLAKAIAHETESRFISVKGPEVLDKYVGEAQKFVDTLFETARSLSPAVIFIDEIDSIADQRGGQGSERASDHVINQLLIELDGLDELSDIVVIGATNRPDMIDSALTRPGRLGREIHVPFPGEEAQSEIFQVHTSNRSLAADVSIEWLVRETPDRISGARIAAICEDASRAALRRTLAETGTPNSDEIQIRRGDFERALEDNQNEESHPRTAGFQ
ncbi:AAA family ATPase [Halostella salina]|uniref:AAA family ATPase n=1 Tax=Halostella salina TaxID=1547897 RepID=UPI000EF84BF4|nr:AAA family ATPase [Halostella salina]